MEGDRAVLIYDKFDIWKFPMGGGNPVNLTGGEGRRDNRTFRILRMDPEQEAFASGETLLLSGYHHTGKSWGFHAASVDGGTPKPLLTGEKRYTFLKKAKKADVLLYTRESYEEFPDLWTADPGFSSPSRLSDVNPQISQFAWGSAELVEWESADGIPLQGVLIKPGNFQPGTPCPVIVYYYRFFSQRLHEFNQVVINHRPCFPFYASNGYAVFLPDIRFDVGLPGPAAVKCLVPGIQKIIDMGVADPDAIGLHGHSWSGYQTAFVITRTDIFRCAVAGAPVSNMTSAYSGIRWASGMARQFQYEQSQSRIGASLWERRDLYIENSPVFFADRIRTPLLIIHGDDDGAVPWYQSIELYLAMRRLGKDCVFLQYRGEPHHPQKYPNKLDWFKKMKEYFDHYLKGAPGPDWITRGVPYRGH
jgi:dipeptidyl aminopeptidase/acylaminoacyl peptidase